MNEVDTDDQSRILGWLPEGYFCFKFLFQSRPVHWQKWNEVGEKRCRQCNPTSVVSRVSRHKIISVIVIIILLWKFLKTFSLGTFFDWKQFEFSSAETVWIHSRQTMILEFSVTNSQSQREETLSHLVSSEQACNPSTQRLRHEDHKFEAQPVLHSEF